MWGWELLQATEYIGWTGTNISPKDYSRVSADNRGWAVAAQLRQEAKELQMGWKLGHWLTGGGGRYRAHILHQYAQNDVARRPQSLRRRHQRQNRI